MKISKIIQAHDSSHHNLAEIKNIGDGYLLMRNPAFRCLREAVGHHGFTLSQGEPAQYYAWPLMALEEILKTKTIPFLDNVTPLRTLEKKQPNKFTLDEIISLPPHKNVILHESSHCVAESLIKQGKPAGQTVNRNQQILQVMLGESFANATESLGNIYVKNKLDRFIYCDMNSNVELDEETIIALRAIEKKFGTGFTCRALVLAFLHFNCLYKTVSKYEIIKTIEILCPDKSLSKNDEKNLLIVMKMALRMFEGSRTITSKIYLKASGIVENNFLQAFNFDFYPMLTPDKYLGQVLTGMGEIYGD